MKKCNKLVSFVLLLTFIFSLTYPSITSLAETKPVIYVNEMFDDVVTNDVPDGLSILKGTDGRVVIRDEKTLDKAAYAHTLASGVSMSAAVSELPDKYVISADIMIDGTRTEGDIISIKASSSIPILKAKRNGELLLNNGYRVGGYKLGAWNNYTFVINKLKHKYDFYMNGKRLISDFYISGSISSESAVDFNIKKPAGGNAGLYVDNVRVYSGDKVMKETFFPKAEKNHSDIPFQITENIKIGNRIFLSSDGKDGIAPYFSPKIGKAEFAPLPDEEKQRMYFYRSGGVSSDIFADITLVGTEDLIRFVYQLDVYPAQFGSDDTMCTLASGNKFNIHLMGNGSIVHNGVTLLTIPRKKWSTLTFVVKTDMMTMDVYLNGEPVVKDVYTEASAPQTMRIGFANEAYEAEMYLDKIQFYEGSEPRDITKEADAYASALTFIGDSEYDVADAAKGGTVFMTERDVVYYNGEKTSYTALGTKPIYENDVLFVDIDTANMVMSSGIRYDAESGLIKTDSSEAVIGKKTVNVDGKELSLDAAPFVSENKAYIPIASFAEKALGLYCYRDSRGWIYTNKTNWRLGNDFSYANDREASDIIDAYLQFDRPSGQKIYDDIVANGNYQKHPRLFATPESVIELRANIEKNITMRKWANGVIAAADGLCNRDPVPYNIPDGLRLFLSCLEVRNRLYVYATAYLATGNSKYAEGAWKEIENACNWKDWNVDRHYLDSGKIGPGMALAYDVFYNEFTTEQKAFMRKRIKELYLDYATAVYAGRTSMNVTFNNGNWGSVCNGSVLMWCLATMDEEDPDSDYTKTVKHLAACALQGLEPPIRKLYSLGGVWNEGPSYFQYVFEYSTWSALSLTNSCGTDYGLLDYPGFSLGVDYIMYVQTSNGYFNLQETGDGGSGAKLNSPEVFLVAKLNKDKALNDAWYSMSFNILKRSVGTLDLLFYTPTATTDNTIEKFPLDKHFDVVDMESMRSSWTSPSAKAVCVTAGYQNGGTHFDMGNFSFDALGVRWAVDLGKVNQAVAGGYLGKDGWTLYRRRTEGHNCVVINPDETPGQKPYTTGYVEKSEYKPKGTYAIYNLSECYSENTSAYKRGIYFGDNRNTLTVQDEFTLLKGGSDIYWFMHTQADIDISPDGKSAVLSQNGQKLRVEFETNASDVKLQVMDAKPLPTTPERPDQKKNEKFRKLVLTGKGSRDCYITAKLIPVEQRGNYEGAKYVPMSEWSIPDGEIEPMMNVTGIKIDGNEMYGFDPIISEYTYSTIDTSRIPIVSATAVMGEVTVKQASKIGDYAEIILTDGVETHTYRIHIEEGIIDSLAQTDETLMPAADGTVIDELTENKMVKGTPLGMHRHQVAGFYAADAQSGNPGQHMFDADMSTKWASDLDAVEIVVDLGSAKPINGVALAFTNGNARNYKFEILISDDNINYKRVFTGQSTGETAEYEHLSFNANARYVRFKGFGHASGAWNNINEFAPYFID